jgi:hypothetical protein
MGQTHLRCRNLSTTAKQKVISNIEQAKNKYAYDLNLLGQFSNCLVELAERSDTGQARRVARFLASTYNGEAYPFDLFDLRVLDVTLSDDALVCIDALRWGRADLYKLLPNGERRIAAVISNWGLDKSEDSAEP